MRLKFKEPCSTRRQIISLLIEMGFYEGTGLPDWVRLAHEDLVELNHMEAEEMLKDLKRKHSDLIRLYNQRWLSIIKPYSN